MFGPTKAQEVADNLLTIQQAIWRGFVVVVPQDPSKPDDSPYILTDYGQHLYDEMSNGNN